MRRGVKASLVVIKFSKRRELYLDKSAEKKVKFRGKCMLRMGQESPKTNLEKGDPEKTDSGGGKKTPSRSVFEHCVSSSSNLGRCGKKPSRALEEKRKQIQQAERRCELRLRTGKQNRGLAASMKRSGEMGTQKN